MHHQLDACVYLHVGECVLDGILASAYWHERDVGWVRKENGWLALREYVRDEVQKCGAEKG